MNPEGLPAAEVLTFGETMGSIRASGLLRHGGAMTMSLGGAETNVAIGLARLGHRVRWAGRLGQDEVGAFALRTLRAENVLTDAVVADDRRPTGMMLLENRFAGVSRAAYYRAGSAGSALTVEDLRPAVAAGPRILHLTGITPALSPAAAEAALWAARAAKDAGALVSFDVNYRSKLWDRDTAAAALRPLADLADVIIASEDELGLVLAEQGQTGWNAARELYRRGVRDVIIKRGAQGARGYSGAAVIDQPALDVRAVDTVGAGDAFTAGYLSALLDGETLERRLRRGVILGAFAVAASGDWENLPTRDELALAGHTAGSTIR